VATGGTTVASRGAVRKPAQRRLPTCATRCYGGCVKTISQRELRNDNAKVMRGVEEGETYTVTRRGVPVALLVPLPSAADLRCDRPAKRRPEYATQSRVCTKAPTSELLTDLRGDR
jgi:prevent-host-death family protein